MKESYDDINEQLLIKHMLGETDALESTRVNEWLAADSGNRKVYEHVVLIWEKSLEMPAGRKVDENAAWERMRAVISAPAGRARATQSPAAVPLLRNWMRIAAMLIVIAGGLIAALLVFQSPATQIVSSQGAALTDTLPDGSYVTLNKLSSITHPEKFGKKSRTVALKGEAFFNIKPDKTKPFVIDVEGVQVKVVGTSFNIRSTSDSTEIIVETGIVEVTKDAHVLTLRAGEKVTIHAKDTTFTSQPVQDKLYNYYRSREFVCDNTPLWKLVEVLNEAYNSEIVIGRKELRNLPLTTTFSNEPLEKILAVIQQTFSISVEREGKRIILK